MLQKSMAILWPSFLAAIIAEGCFFSLFVPSELPVAYDGLELTAAAVYTIGFFFLLGTNRLCQYADLVLAGGTHPALATGAGCSAVL